MRARLIALVVVVLTALVAVPLTSEPEAGAVSVLNGSFYFHGQPPSDDGSRASGPPFTATFDNVAPTGSTGVPQTGPGFAEHTVAGNPLAIFWVASIPAGTFAVS